MNFARFESASANGRAKNLGPDKFTYETSPLIRGDGVSGIRCAVVVRALRWREGAPNLTDGRSGTGHGAWHFIQRSGAGPEIVTGHDFRSYSLDQAGISLRADGRRRPGRDIGLALSRWPYFARFALDVPWSRW